MASHSVHQRLRRRLRPLLIANFLQELIFWYGIEKLFMTKIGFDGSSIALAVTVSTVTTLFMQIPTGLLADRWSRKGVLMLASIVLCLTSLIGGLSHHILLYLVASGLWGIYYAMRSGIFDPIIYDTLLEETGHTEDFEHYFGQQQIANSAALFLGSLLSGVVASNFGLRAPFLITLPFAIASFIVLFWFREPTLHRLQEPLSLGKHLLQTLEAILHSGAVFWLVGTAIVAGATILLLFQFTQLWFIALALPVLLFGPFHALLNLSIGLSGPLARLIRSRHSLLIGITCLTTAFAFVLRMHSAYAIVVAQTAIITCLLAAGIVLNHRLHDTLSSHIRSGASSAVGALTQLLYIPLALAFGWASTRYAIFGAAWIVIGLCAFTVFGVVKSIRLLNMT